MLGRVHYVRLAMTGNDHFELRRKGQNIQISPSLMMFNEECSESSSYVRSIVAAIIESIGQLYINGIPFYMCCISHLYEDCTNDILLGIYA